MDLIFSLVFPFLVTSTLNGVDSETILNNSMTITVVEVEAASQRSGDTRRGSVTFYTEECYKGEKYQNLDFLKCDDLPQNPAWIDKPLSVKTHGTCVVLYKSSNCSSTNEAERHILSGCSGEANLHNLKTKGIASNVISFRPCRDYQPSVDKAKYVMGTKDVPSVHPAAEFRSDVLRCYDYYVGNTPTKYTATYVDTQGTCIVLFNNFKCNEENGIKAILKGPTREANMETLKAKGINGNIASIRPCSEIERATCEPNAQGPRKDNCTVDPPPPKPSPTGLQNGDPCNTTICEVELNCHSYLACQRSDTSGNPDNTNGTVVTITCPKGLFAAPLVYSDQEPEKVMVAVCLKWENLTNDRKKEVLSEPDCSYCEIIPQNICGQQFVIRYNNGILGANHTCPENLVIDPIRRSCEKPCNTNAELKAACVSNGKCIGS